MVVVVVEVVVWVDPSTWTSHTRVVRETIITMVVVVVVMMWKRVVVPRDETVAAAGPIPCPCKKPTNKPC